MNIKKKIKRYMPVRIFNVRMGYGWWWGNYFIFFGKYRAPLSMMPMDLMISDSEYASNGRAIGHGDSLSWSVDRQEEAYGHVAGQNGKEGADACS